MSLYRHDSTGFLCEFASAPGAGYTAISAMPGDLAGRTTWWRTLDTYGQTSNWHPSLQQTAENPYPSYPDLRAGSGVNIVAPRYSVFEETALPPLSSSGITSTLGTGGYLSAKYLQLTSTTTNGTTYLSSSSVNYNVKLTPNSKWIISVYCAPTTSSAKSFAVLVKCSGGTTYTVSLTTGATAGSWTRQTGTLDLSADSSPQAVMAYRIVSSGVSVRFDGLMMEEQQGTLSTPSAFSAPPSTIDGQQVNDSSVPGTKLISIDASTITVSNLNATNLTVGTINGSRFGTDTIGSGPIISGALHRQYGSTTAAFPINMVNSAYIGASSTWSSPLTLTSFSDRSAVVCIVMFTPQVGNAWDPYGIVNDNAVYTGGANLQKIHPPGMIAIGIAKGTTTNIQTNTRSSQSMMFWGTSQIMTMFYDAAPGTGALTYYCGMHHTMANSGTINVTFSSLVLEFAKS